MVLFTMTAAMVTAIEEYQALHESEPRIEDPQVGKPISHTEIIDIHRKLRAGRSMRTASTTEESQESQASYHLDDLLRGSTVYVPPPTPRPEPSAEYKALMARLRREEEERAYERMVNPPPPMETFAQRFPSSSHANLFNSTSLPAGAEEDEITYEEVHRQVMLIINILVSILACGVAIWLVSSHWSTPKRLGLSMGGSGIVGIAEVAVYIGYLRRLQDAKKKEAKHKEKKEIVDTWVIGADKKRKNAKALRRADPPSLLQLADGEKVRRRRIKANK